MPVTPHAPSQSAQKNVVQLSDLPNEIFIKIFQHLSLNELAIMATMNNRNRALANDLIEQRLKKKSEDLLAQIPPEVRAVFTAQHAKSLFVHHQKQSFSFDAFMLNHFAKTSTRPLLGFSELMCAGQASSIALYRMDQPVSAAVIPVISQERIKFIMDDLHKMKEKGVKKTQSDTFYILGFPLYMIFSLLGIFGLNGMSPSASYFAPVQTTVMLVTAFAAMVCLDMGSKATRDHMNLPFIIQRFVNLPGADSLENKRFIEWLHQTILNADQRFLPEDYTIPMNELEKAVAPFKKAQKYLMILPTAYLSIVLAPAVMLTTTVAYPLMSQRSNWGIRMALEVSVYMQVFTLIYLAHALRKFTKENVVIDESYFNVIVASLGAEVAVLGTLMLEEMVEAAPALMHSAIEQSSALLSRGTAQVERGLSTLRSWCPSWGRQRDLIEPDIEKGLLNDDRSPVLGYGSIN